MGSSPMSSANIKTAAVYNGRCFLTYEVKQYTPIVKLRTDEFCRIKKSLFISTHLFRVLITGYNIIERGKDADSDKSAPLLLIKL